MNREIGGVGIHVHFVLTPKYTETFNPIILVYLHNAAFCRIRVVWVRTGEEFNKKFTRDGVKIEN